MKNILLSALLTVAATTLTSTMAQAQSYGGAVLDHDIMMPADFAQLSKTHAFGTARSMAMGGAFTSLGGDVSSTSINPAGLGMFSQEVISLSPMLSSTNASTTAAPSWVGNNKTSFGMANMGATFKLLESSSGSLIAVNGAITYNRISDYNSKMSFSSESIYDPSTDVLIPSIVDVFGMQLAGASISPSSNGSMEYDDNPYFWPAQGAYKTYLLDTTDNGGWTTNVIGHNASVLSSYEVWQKGRADEYGFAIAGNISNVLYFGATLGIQDIRQTTEYNYQEEYNYYSDGGYAYASASDNDPLDYQAAYSHLSQKVTLSGSGANLKLGLTARPTRAIRVGVAFHSPTYYSLARTYQSTVESKLLGNYSDTAASTTYWSTSPEMIDSYEYSWDFRTPAKLLVGASLQVGAYGVIAVDYERQWYNWIRVTNAPGEYTPYDYQLSYENNYQPVNTLRFGVEVKPVPTISLRAGGGLSGSMLKDESLFYSTPVATENHYITAGLGIQLSANTTFDIAYQLYHQDYSSYRLFYAESDGEMLSGSKLFESSLNSNYITATFTFRL